MAERYWDRYPGVLQRVDRSCPSVLVKKEIVAKARRIIGHSRRSPGNRMRASTGIFHIAFACVSLLIGAHSSVVASSDKFLPIVDVHVHIIPNRDTTHGTLSFVDPLEIAVQTMDRFGIARAIVMAPPRGRLIGSNYDYSDNSGARIALDRYPGRFAYLIGGGSLNPTLHANADSESVTESVVTNFVATAQRAIDDGALGFGEMSSLHISLSPKHGYNYVPADHPLMLALADVAAERGVPIDLHMDAVAVETAPPPRLAQLPNNPSRFPATLDALERLLAHNERARIVWAHGGSDQLVDLTAERITTLMDRHPNLFMSLRVVDPRTPLRNKLFAGPQIEPEWLSLLTRHADRFVIGTDSFYVGANPAGVGEEFGRRTLSKLEATVRFLSLLPPDLAGKIASGNAMRIYNLAALMEIQPPEAVRATAPADAGLCRDGNMEHCRIVCARGVKKACARLEKNR